MYACLASNCVDQTGLWDGVTCEHALKELSCNDAADLSGHDPSQQITKFTGTVADACPRSCKSECAKCPAPEPVETKKAVCDDCVVGESACKEDAAFVNSILNDTEKAKKDL